MSGSPQEPGPTGPPTPGPDPAGTSAPPLPLRRFLKRLPELPLTGLH